MPGLRNTIVMCALMAGLLGRCGGIRDDDASDQPPDAATTEVAAASTTSATTVDHDFDDDPSAIDVRVPVRRQEGQLRPPPSRLSGHGRVRMRCNVVAPIGGKIEETRIVDPWVPKVDDPATRGGKYVSMEGDDGVRYYFAHLESVAVRTGDVVEAGDPLGVMGQTGNARKSACHTHFGISWPCAGTRMGRSPGEIWPWKYLDAWRDGEQLSPVTKSLRPRRRTRHVRNLATLAPSADNA